MHPLIAAAVANHVIEDRRTAAERARRHRPRRALRAARVDAAAPRPAHRRRLAWRA